MLDVFRRGQRWWTAAVVVFVGGVFAVFIGLGGPLQGGGAGTMVQVGPYHMDVVEFERVRAQREEEIRTALGDSFDARRLRDTIDTAAARLMVDRAIMALEAQELGLQVTREEVEREILEIPNFRDETGRFDKELFDNWVAYEFGSEHAFLEQQRRQSLAGKLLRVLRAQTAVSEGEARDALERRLEGVQIAYVALDPSAIPEGFERDESAIEALLTEREAAARQLYEDRADRYDIPERTRARHILLRVARDASEEQRAVAEELANQVLERLDAGESFAEVAEEVSEDPGSKANGGDLGYFARGQMVPEFDEVAFSLEPGTRSELVRTDYGYHVIRVEDRKPAELKTFEEVKADLAHELLGQEAGSEATRATAERLSEAVRSGKTLEEAARAEELTLERTGVLQRRPDGYIPGLGPAQDLMAVAFTLEPGESSDQVFDLAAKLALVQVLERTEPEASEIESQLDAERARLRNAKLDRYLQAWVNERRNELVESGELHVDLSRAGRG